MTTRRDFLVGTGAGLAALGAAADGRGQGTMDLIDRIVPPDEHQPEGPRVVSTWRHGLTANEAAWPIIDGAGSALDAVEAGVRVTEADPEITSVGYGGLPDRDGRVTLDACIMDGNGQAGSVAYLQNILHPVSVARRVMEATPHVMLAGQGARRFAVEQGFPETDLLTDEARDAWQKWCQEKDHTPWPPSDPANHDTISMLALDGAGHLAGSCTTSGRAFKMHGRVGDSPIIGAALFVEDDVGAACATGDGEEVMSTVGSFLVVELMRQGASPQEACEEGVRRIVARHEDITGVQVGYLAIDTRGRVGAFSIQPWFQYAVTDGRGGTRLVDAASHVAK